ncbi:Uncharacterised protein [Salmonella enterica subsp. arizonae]|uniref:Uncharacterized protein n=1 Tax=Salmonella enterica subsp. arizonae TaxID=59203 RepID=A0A379TMS1_SALER|nr:Uncharacterised protein [Salmonella enterica subsp. arizonae]
MDSLWPNLATAGPQVRHASALIVCGNFERASCTGRVFFEDERNIFTHQLLFLFTVFLIGFQFGGKLATEQ